MADGSPHVAPVWLDTGGRFVLVNTARGYVKHRNVRRDPRVATAVTERCGAALLLAIRGRVAAVRSEGAVAHVDKLARKYEGASITAFRPGNGARSS